MGWISGLDASWQTAFSNTDFDSSRYEMVSVSSSSAFQADRSVALRSGEAVSISEAIGRMESLDFPCGGDSSVSCADSTATFFLDASLDVTLGRFSTSMDEVGVFVAAGSTMRMDVATINGDVTFSLEADSRLSFSNAVIEGSAKFSGEGLVSIDMDPSTTARSLLHVNGDVTLSGDARTATVDVSASWSYAPEVTVSNLFSAGNWIGAGTVNVEGNFTFSGPAMQPLLNVSADGNVTIASVLFFGTEALIAGEVVFVDNGGRSSFAEVDVRDTAVISFKVDDAAFSSISSFSSSSSSFFAEPVTVFKYGADTDYESFNCEIRLMDSRGASIPVLMRPPNASSTIATATASGAVTFQPNNKIAAKQSCVYGEWTNTSLQVTAGECPSSSSSSSRTPTRAVLDAADSSAPSLLLLGAVIAAVCAL